MGDFLDFIVDTLDLSETQYGLIKRAYESVGRYLAEGDDPLLSGAVIYSQGSVRLNTTVKPKGSEQYDVDLLCYLPNASLDSGWANVLEAVRSRLASHSTYSEMLSPLPRGHRIMYAGEYHLDITPGIDWSNNHSEENHPLMVPDSRLQDWKESNPAGYATWFDAITEKFPVFFKLEVACESFIKSAAVRPLPDHTQKKLLNRIVQILKRHRDVWAAEGGKERVDHKPISAIITTLAAHAYNRICDERRAYDTDFDVILDVLALMPEYIRCGSGIYSVPNPSMPAENFAEKWNVGEARKGEKLRNNFELWHQTVTNNIIEIASSVGEDQLLDKLSKYFGERPVKAVQEAMLGGVNTARNNNTLRSSALTGALTAGVASTAAASTRTVPANTFYGSDSLSATPVQKNTFFGD
ncbi:hypothetical protein ABR27_10720 [Enterobacter hormaechei subsp. hormaechei]|uniref:nucleotidyltransferase domain-containing protein n=1 Tax=Enterobacter hormaechei TaxID=158836 RepID=UPI000643379E|nr:hypothetical protein ABR27_10720 [Enterobacter hormaechei subsp. hormaechei]